MKRIHLAGGCFWGLEHYLKNIGGVLSTEVGFANGNLDSPTYEQVYTDTTGFAETVAVSYDPSILPLKELLEDYFCAIDPYSVNKQGEDEGTRYRTGIYYSDPEELPVIEAVCGSVGGPLAVEVCPLRNFFPADERHQEYLSKNPGGYCHLPLKIFRYAVLATDMKNLLGDETDAVARMANASALLKERMGFFWAGFYLVKDGALVLGPFQGPVACTRIGYGKGVCGTAWKEARTIVVPDVEEFPGHIACSSESKSEIVIPLTLPDGSVKGVLDIDSDRVGSFDGIDAHWLGRIAALV